MKLLYSDRCDPAVLLKRILTTGGFLSWCRVLSSLCKILLGIFLFPGVRNILTQSYISYSGYVQAAGILLARGKFLGFNLSLAPAETYSLYLVIFVSFISVLGCIGFSFTI